MWRSEKNERWTNNSWILQRNGKKLFVLKQKKEKQTIKNHSNELEKTIVFTEQTKSQKKNFRKR